MVSPEHIVVLPVIAAGNGLIVATVEAVQPVLNEYVITEVSVDATICAVSTPVFALITAAAGLLLVHTPPPGASVKADVVPAHNVVVPMILPGSGLTVTTVEVVHPVGNV